MSFDSRLSLIRELETRTERVYHEVNGNPGVSTPGGRQEPEAISTIHDIIHALTQVGYITKSAYADILFNIANEYQNDDYCYYLQFYTDAIETIKERVQPDIH